MAETKRTKSIELHVFNTPEGPKSWDTVEHATEQEFAELSFKLINEYRLVSTKFEDCNQELVHFKGEAKYLETKVSKQRHTIKCLKRQNAQLLKRIPREPAKDLLNPQ